MIDIWYIRLHKYIPVYPYHFAIFQIQKTCLAAGYLADRRRSQELQLFGGLRFH